MFIYENVCKESALDKLAAEFEESHRIKDFDWSVPNKGAFCGSIEGAKWMRDNRQGVKVWCNFENYLCSTYYPKVGELLFNEKYAFIPFKELPRRKWDLYVWLGNSAMVFIRPDSGEKIPRLSLSICKI